MNDEKQLTIWDFLNPTRTDKKSRKVERATKKAEKVIKKTLSQTKKK